MAPVPGPYTEEPTLCVGFCTALYSRGAVAGHSPAGKKPEKRAATSDARGTAHGACGPPKNPRGSAEVARDSNTEDPKRRYVTPFPIRAYRVSSSGLPI